MKAFILSRLQRHRVINGIKRVHRLGTVLRSRCTILRRTYVVKRPNALWHCDGHHKLIRWGFVIHGFIDGFSRMVSFDSGIESSEIHSFTTGPQVVALRASGSNSSKQVLKVFKSAFRSYGQPSRLRGDRGGENVEVSTWMIMHRGLNRASFIWGS